MRTQRLVALFVLGTLLLSYPLLTLANRPLQVAGIPLLYLYLFVVWGGLVAGAAWLIERRRSER